MAELKPCPWCGSRECKPRGVNFVYSILCSKCTGEGPLRESEPAAVKAWNDRATPPPPSTAEVDERAAIEMAAKAIYRLFDLADIHPWVERGNSDMQDTARRYARAAFASRPAVEAGGLPPLPETDVHTGDEVFGDNVSSFSPAAMRDYGQACARAALATKPATKE